MIGKTMWHFAEDLEKEKSWVRWNQWNQLFISGEDEISVLVKGLGTNVMRGFGKFKTMSIKVGFSNFNKVFEIPRYTI